MNSLEESLPPKNTSPTNSTLDSIVKTVSSSTKSISENSPATSTSKNSSMDWKIVLIALLIILLILMYLGINFFNIFGNTLQSIVNLTSPVVKKIFGAFGYATGETINQTADVASDTIKTGVNVAEGVVQSVGNLLIDASEEADPTTRLKMDLEKSSKDNTSSDPQIDSTENPIQNSISAGKQNWCLVGEFQNKRGCVPITDSDKCLSGQVFPNQQMCLNPTFTQK